MKRCPGCHKEALLLWTRYGERCSDCASGSALEPSARQMRRFSWGFAGASVAQFLLLPLLPGFALSSLLGALWYRVEGAVRMLPGIVGVFLFWILLLPPLARDPQADSVLIATLFAVALLIISGPPFLRVVRLLLLRGHGFLAGAVLSSLFVAVSFSLLAPVLLLLFLQ